VGRGGGVLPRPRREQEAAAVGGVKSRAAPVGRAPSDLSVLGARLIGSSQTTCGRAGGYARFPPVTLVQPVLVPAGLTVVARREPRVPHPVPRRQHPPGVGDWVRPPGAAGASRCRGRRHRKEPEVPSGAAGLAVGDLVCGLGVGRSGDQDARRHTPASRRVPGDLEVRLES
jgi:hypothetical protein